MFNEPNLKKRMKKKIGSIKVVVYKNNICRKKNQKDRNQNVSFVIKEKN